MERRIYFEATNCRNQCFHCYCPSLSSAREMMTPHQIVEIAKDFRDSLEEPVRIGILREPMLYPELVSLIKMAHFEGLFEPNREDRLLYTNGEAFSLEFLTEIAPVINHVVFTLFGTEMMHDALAGRMGAYRRIERATSLAHQADFHVTWRIVITKGSEGDLAKLYDRAKALKVDQIDFSAHFYLSGMMRNAYENIPTSITMEKLKEMGLPVSTEGMRPEWEYAKNPDMLRETKIPKLNFTRLYLDRNMGVYPLNQIEPDLCIGNYQEGKALLFDRLKGQANFPESIRRANQISLYVLAERFANVHSKQMLTPQMLFEKYYRKLEF